MGDLHKVAHHTNLLGKPHHLNHMLAGGCRCHQQQTPATPSGHIAFMTTPTHSILARTTTANTHPFGNVSQPAGLNLVGLLWLPSAPVLVCILQLLCCTCCSHGLPPAAGSGTHHNTWRLCRSPWVSGFLRDVTKPGLAAQTCTFCTW